MKYTSINISYVALNVLIDIIVENRTISLGKDSTLNSSGIFKDKIKISILKVGDSLHYWTDESRLTSESKLLLEQKSLTSTTNQSLNSFLTKIQVHQQQPKRAHT